MELSTEAGISERLVKPNCFLNDGAFDWLYPERIQRLSRRHWTPLGVAKASARFLANKPGAKILDIGSGVGKFCLVGGHYFPDAYFYGVEQREELHQIALEARDMTGKFNVEFIHGNFTHLDMDDFDNFYFYNSFFENLDHNDRIDHQIAYSPSLYVYYCKYLFKLLDARPSGTRLVTFHSLGDEIPPAYHLVESSIDTLLKMYIKK
ncbi:hypothetical protein CLV59_101724 [Chitinophaga dinghuensis]|uniref:Methyltransferase family protein n=1 Tax=Chitinophaga dinghuensis TaxID=1539050 RepID=A0A327WCK1_9BACT|nr:class I SAM-dependent methyltransferase [Chitinophaga dinghuensis]RAJ87959.1 hypothetical protein CLV59_101724 [Chitinophaga dinghuensis]